MRRCAALVRGLASRATFCAGANALSEAGLIGLGRSVAPALSSHINAVVSAASLPAHAPRGFASDAEGSSLYNDLEILYPPPSARVGAAAPAFSAPAVVDGEIKKISLSDYKGKYVVLFFYPKDFTFVCPTEIIAFSDRAKEFEALNTKVIAASTDTEECHLAWIRTPRKRGGLGFMQIPIMADTTKEISAKYGVLIEKLGIALRGLFIINPEGIIQQITINDLPIGRSVDEVLRLVQAIQYHAKHGEVCPANWKPGDKAMVADTEKSLEYFQTVKDVGGEDVFGNKLTPIKSRAHYDELIKAGKPLLVDFYAPWCGKCRQMGPFLDQLVDKYPGVTFAKFDTTAPELEAFAGELAIKALPAFRFFKGGKEVGEPMTGYKKQGLEDALKRYLA